LRQSFKKERFKTELLSRGKNVLESEKIVEVEAKNDKLIKLVIKQLNELERKEEE